MSRPSGPLHDGSISHLTVATTSGSPGMVDLRTSFSAPSYLDTPIAACNPHICV